MHTHAVLSHKQKDFHISEIDKIVKDKKSFTGKLHGV